MNRSFGISRALIFIILAISACTSQVSPASTPNPTTAPLPIPTTTFSPMSTQDIASPQSNMLPMQVVISVEDGHDQSVKTITMTGSVVGQITRGSYSISNFSDPARIFVAVSFPTTLELSQYAITQPLDPSYISADPTLPAAIFRALPSEHDGYEEAETAGNACNQALSGQLTLTNKRPLQGDFQFNCRFQDGFSASIAGTFSQ